MSTDSSGWDGFAARHLGTDADGAAQMAHAIGYPHLAGLITDAVPANIRIAPDDARYTVIPDALDEHAALDRLRGIMGQNKPVKSLIGLGYHGTLTPPVIQRNLLENPGWYTAYTPYQAEISQGRLEALLNFQTMVCDLTGLDVANASLLDEGTAVAEAIALAQGAKPKGTTAFISETCHSHVLDVVRTRAELAGIELVIGDPTSLDPADIDSLFAVVLSYPDTLGGVADWSSLISATHDAGALAILTADPLALCILKTPGEMGADICVGNSQRFGVPLGFGGPHAAFIAVKDPLKRKLPGRLVGVSIDRLGNPAYRLSLQTREQHIRRDKATSNICTAQVLLAVIASMYACWHGPKGLRAIASRIHGLAGFATSQLKKAGFEPTNDTFFDTIAVPVRDPAVVLARTLESGINLRSEGNQVIIAFDETTSVQDVINILGNGFEIDESQLADQPEDLLLPALTGDLTRTEPLLQHPVFSAYHTETEMLRYLRRLQGKDIALDTSMIPLGSCTMKLNAAAEMMPLSWPEVSSIHPYAPADQATGYHQMFEELENWLAAATGFHSVSLQPNAGSQGEYAGLLAIRRYHEANHKDGDPERTACLIPTSAHGTNPASAVMCGFKVIPVACDEEGNIDITDLKAKIEEHRATLGALMVTYPSTHGVFETTIKEICTDVHAAGGQVYMDGANMNAQVGLTSPGEIGADVCHLNLHKTFCIPHGGGGPGVGPIGVAEHLTPHLPGHELLDHKIDAVSSAPWGSASICTISWMYIAMMGADGLRTATEVAILNANYIAKRLGDHYPILYTGEKGLVAHECILDLRDFEVASVEDVAKRLIDYGFHAPTMSWPVTGTLMVEPTESESRRELDRFCDAMLAIHGEIMAIKNGELDPEDNPLKNAPHTASELLSDDWSHPYSRSSAALPYDSKYWPPVARIDNVHGDRNLVCTCEGMEAYADRD